MTVQKRSNQFLSDLFSFAVLLLFSLLMIVPFVWMLSTSLKPTPEIFLFPPTLLPRDWTLRHYKELFGSLRFLNPILNSIFVSVTVTLFSTVFASMTGFAFAKFAFRGKKALFSLCLATLMIPGQMTIIPVFILLKYLGWINTYQGLIVPPLANAFAIFFMRQFLMKQPNELIEAARLDGLSDIRIFFSVILPMARPALFTLSILTFTGTWNAFLWPLIVATDEKLYTLSLAVSLLKGQYGDNFGLQMAGSSLVILPLILIFFFFRKQLTSGIASSISLK